MKKFLIGLSSLLFVCLLVAGKPVYASNIPAEDSDASASVSSSQSNSNTQPDEVIAQPEAEIDDEGVPEGSISRPPLAQSEPDNSSVPLPTPPTPEDPSQTDTADKTPSAQPDEATPISEPTLPPTELLIPPIELPLPVAAPAESADTPINSLDVIQSDDSEYATHKNELLDKQNPEMEMYITAANDKSKVFSGLTRVDGKQYYYSNGERKTGWIRVDGKLYYFDPDKNGAIKKGFVVIPGLGRVYVNYNLDLHTGWLDKNGKRYYVNPDDNVVVKGLRRIEGSRYYFDPKQDGAMAKGFVQINGFGKIYLNGQGKAVTGWLTRNKKTYYADEKNNKLHKGLHMIEGDRYYFDPDTSVAQKGFITVPKYGNMYFRGNFKAAKGWIVRGKNRYYAYPSSSKLRYGYMKLNGFNYWFDKDKKGAASKGIVVTPKNGTFFVTSGFRNAKGWVRSKKGNYYADSKTYLMLTGVQSIAGKTYYFDSTGKLLKSFNIKSSHGIDVSAHQGLIDWAKVKASGKVDFAIIRALTWNKTVGYYVIDPYFDANVRGAKAHGIMVGVYLFTYAFNETEMAEEVNYFLNSSVVRQHKKDGIVYDLPVFIDFEYNNCLVHNPTYEGRTQMLRYGMQLLDQAGYTPGFYASYSWAMNQFNAAALQAEGYDFWMARYYDNVPNKDASQHGWTGKPLSLWQYSSRASIPGINGNVDVNHSYKQYTFTPVPAKTATLSDVVALSASNITKPLMQFFLKALDAIGVTNTLNPLPATLSLGASVVHPVAMVEKETEDNSVAFILTAATSGDTNEEDVSDTSSDARCHLSLPRRYENSETFKSIAFKNKVNTFTPNSLKRDATKNF